MEQALVSFGDVAFNSNKIKANASKHKAMSYGRMIEAEDELATEIGGWLQRAAEADTAEDAVHGDQRGDDVPDWLRDKQQRLERIQMVGADLHRP